MESLSTFIQQHLPNTKVLRLIQYHESTKIITAMQVGVFGYILKDIDQADFSPRIISATVRGEHTLSPVIPDCFAQTVAVRSA